jgi:hypothetical protein
MITVIPSETGHVIGLMIDGKIETDDVELISSLIEERLQEHPKLRVYVELKHLGGISLEALLEDLKLALRHLHHFEKKAVVCEPTWWTNLATASAKLFPHIEVKCFSWSEQQQAREWVRN